MKTKKLEYKSLVFLIISRKGGIEENYLMSAEDFQKCCPSGNQLLQSNPYIWTETDLYGMNSIRIRRCRNTEDFNQYIKGRYNECGKHSYNNQFFTEDDSGVVCRNLFGKNNNTYYLY